MIRKTGLAKGDMEDRIGQGLYGRQDWARVIWKTGLGKGDMEDRTGQG